MDDAFDLKLRTAVYRHFADTGRAPALAAMRDAMGAAADQIQDGYRPTYRKRMLAPRDDFSSIVMAPPFSGVPTQHQARVNGTDYFASCAWDFFGIVSALGGTGEIASRCE